jgi:hypothetical protein
MAATTIKEFLVGLGFDVDEAQLKRFNSGIFKAGVAITALGNLASSAAQEITRAVVQALNPARYAEELDALNDISERTNVAVSDLMRMGYVATLTGADVGTLTSSLEGFTRTAGLAAAGLGRGKQIFEDLGISVKDSNGQLRGTTELLAELQGKIKGMESGQQQALLGRLGIDPKLVTMLTTDVSELNAEYERMQQQAGFSADEAAAKAAEYNDELDKLRAAFSLVGTSAASRLFGPLAKSTEKFRRMIVDNMPKIVAAIEKVVKAFLYVGRVVSSIISRVIAIVDGAVGIFNKVDDATNGWLKTLGLLIIGWRAFNASMLATPIGMVIALAAAIVALIDDFLVWKEGGDSFINWEKWEPAINAAMAAINSFAALLMGAFNTIIGAIQLIVSLLKLDFAGAWEGVKKIFSGLIDVVMNLFKSLMNVGNLIDGVLSPIFGNKPGLTPSPAQQTTLDGTSQTVSQKTEIVVQGAADPQTTARAVAGQQGRVNADMTRNLAPRAR